MMKFDRRTFLKQTFGLTLGAFFTYLAFKKKPRNHAAFNLSKPDHFFVLCSIPGGLDVTLGLDPYIYTNGIDSSDIFIEYRPDEILQKGNLRLGPACLDLIEHHQDLCVVNGLSAVREIGHHANLAYVLTGNVEGHLSTYSMQLARYFPQPPLGVLVNSPLIAGKESLSITDIGGLARSLSNSKPSLSVPGLSEILSGDLKTAAAYLESSEIETYELFRKIEKNGSLADLCFASAAACFSTGLSGSSEIDISSFLNFSNLDSHSNHEFMHLKSQKEAWSLISRLFNIFKSTPYGKTNLFDHTTFVVVSEFSRTPYLNSSKGKDHNPYTNSVLLAGKGVTGNTTVGQSSVLSRHHTPDKASLHIAMPINIKTGEIYKSFSNDADILTPENLARTILEIFNVKTAPLELEKFSTIPRVIKT